MARYSLFPYRFKKVDLQVPMESLEPFRTKGPWKSSITDLSFYK